MTTFSTTPNAPATAIPAPMIEQAVRFLRRSARTHDLCDLSPQFLLTLPWQRLGFTPLPSTEENGRLLVLATATGTYLALDLHHADPDLFEASREPRVHVWETALTAVAHGGVMGTREDLFAWALTQEAALGEELLSITDPALLLTDPALLDALIDKVAAARKDASMNAVSTAVAEADMCLFVPDNDPTHLDDILTRLDAHLTGWLAGLPRAQFVIFEAAGFDYAVFAERDEWLADNYPDYYLDWS